MYKKIKKGLKNPLHICEYIQRSFFSTWIKDDKTYIKWNYFFAMGKFPNLDNPQTFSEKLQWLKLNNINPEYSRMVDKYEAKEYVKEILGEEYIIPTLGVWDSFEDIDFDKLPNQFVLKCTHDSGGLVICQDKSKLDINKARKKINKSLRRNFFYTHREYPYKNVKPRVIAEQYMTDDTIINNGGLTDYKFYCFNGNAYKVMVCLDRETGNTKFYSFDKKWNLLRHNQRGIAAPKNFTLPKPNGMNQMFEMAERLSMNIPFLRVDFYYVNNQIYFGELTFFPDSGMDFNILPEVDKLYGSMIKLTY